jgi:hypothetical protein
MRYGGSKPEKLKPSIFLGKKVEIRSGSPNIPNLRTFKELIYALRSDKTIFQVQKLIS